MTTPASPHRYERFLERRAKLRSKLHALQLKAACTGAIPGIAIWIGYQYLVSLDDFGYSINQIYFALLYLTGFALGLLRRTHVFSASFGLACSQVLAFVIYPNAEGELGNLWPIGAAAMFACALPAVALAHAGSLVRTKFTKPQRAE